jgi:hypothetical protein
MLKTWQKPAALNERLARLEEQVFATEGDCCDTSPLTFFFFCAILVLLRRSLGRFTLLPRRSRSALRKKTKTA